MIFIDFCNCPYICNIKYHKDYKLYFHRGELIQKNFSIGINADVAIITSSFYDRNPREGVVYDIL